MCVCVCAVFTALPLPFLVAAICVSPLYVHPCSFYFCQPRITLQRLASMYAFLSALRRTFCETEYLHVQKCPECSSGLCARKKHISKQVLGMQPERQKPFKHRHFVPSQTVALQFLFIYSAKCHSSALDKCGHLRSYGVMCLDYPMTVYLPAR